MILHLSIFDNITGTVPLEIINLSKDKNIDHTVGSFFSTLNNFISGSLSNDPNYRSHIKYLGIDNIHIEERRIFQELEYFLLSIYEIQDHRVMQTIIEKIIEVCNFHKEIFKNRKVYEILSKLEIDINYILTHLEEYKKKIGEIKEDILPIKTWCLNGSK